MTTDFAGQNTSLKISEVEDVVKQINDVNTVKINTDLLGKIDQIHVLAGFGRPLEQIIKDIESVLMTGCGVSFDPKRINVVQMTEPLFDQEEVHQRPDDSIRSVILGVTSLLNGRTMEIKVKLSINGQIFEGAKTGPVTTSSRLRLVSQATVLAFQSFLGDACNLVAEDIVQLTVTGQPAIVACISLVTDVGEERLLGAAFITNDLKEAVVKATLAAINRRMSLILSD